MWAEIAIRTNSASQTFARLSCRGKGPRNGALLTPSVGAEFLTFQTMMSILVLIRPLAVRPLDYPERVQNPWGFFFLGASI